MIPSLKEQSRYQLAYKYDVNDEMIDPSPDRTYYKIRDEFVEFNEAFLRAKNMTGEKK